jgi:hypothetical protein
MFCGAMARIAAVAPGLRKGCARGRWKGVSVIGYRLMAGSITWHTIKSDAAG